MESHGKFHNFLNNLLSATCIILMDGEESDHGEQP